MRSLHLGIFAAAVVVVGCAPAEQKPSYADLVSIYTNEAQELDRLERKRAEMVAEYEATLRPANGDARAALSRIIGDMADAEGDGPKLDAADPNELLDQAISGVENLNEQAGTLAEALAEQTSSAAASREAIEAMYSEEFKAQLAEMDDQIASQRARVEKARADRDAAETK